MLPDRLAATAVFEIPSLDAEVTALIIHRITDTMVNIWKTSQLIVIFYSYNGYCYCFKVCFCGPPINIPIAPAIVIIIPMSWIYFHG